MNNTDLDVVAKAAINELAILLSADLESAIQHATSSAIERIGEEAVGRVREINAATQRIIDLVNNLGEDIRSRIITALNDDLNTDVLPVLTVETEKIAKSVKDTMSEEFQPLKQLVLQNGALISASEAHLKTVAEEYATAVSANFHDVKKVLLASVTTAITTITSDRREGVSTTTEIIRNQLDDKATQLVKTVETAEQKLSHTLGATENQLRKVLADTALSTDTSIARASTLLSGQLTNLDETISKLRHDSIGTLENAQQRLESLTGKTAKDLRDEISQALTGIEDRLVNIVQTVAQATDSSFLKAHSATTGQLTEIADSLTVLRREVCVSFEKLVEQVGTSSTQLEADITNKLDLQAARFRRILYIQVGLLVSVILAIMFFGMPHN